MRIKHIYISKYKNLKKFSVDFSEENFLEVFVGKNGSGKSNLFEALIEIFKHLYEDDYQIVFDYTLTYEINGKSVFIKWEKSNWIDSDNNKVKRPPRRVLPDHVLLYYSGHNPKISNLLSTYEKDFRDTLNRNRNTIITYIDS